jgi:hypothetical protein
MELEQWEKDLRKQLADVRGRSFTAAPHEAWEDNMLQEIADVSPKKPIKNNNFFVVCLIVLGCLTTFAYLYKTGHLNHPVKPSIKMPEKPTEIESLKTAIRNFQETLSEHEKILDEVQIRSKRNTERINLMGILFNENFAIVRAKADNNELIFLKRDWRINKLPSHISLTEEDQAYLKKYLVQ